jgi:hypothetical protein
VDKTPARGDTARGPTSSSSRSDGPSAKKNTWCWPIAACRRRGVSTYLVLQQGRSVSGWYGHS